VSHASLLFKRKIKEKKNKIVSVQVSHNKIFESLRIISLSWKKVIKLYKDHQLMRTVLEIYLEYRY